MVWKPLVKAVADALVMRRLLSYARSFDQLVIQHPEEPSLAAAGEVTEGEIATRLGLPGITPMAEIIMIERDLRLVEITGARYHITHISTAAGVEAVSIFPFSPYPGTELYDELAAAHRVRLDAAYFQSLVYTDLARMVSYNELFTTAQLRALVLVGNALFLAVQAATHPRRVLGLAIQVLRREQSSKFANAIEPMRRRREVFRKLSAQGAPASTSPDAA